MKALTLALFLAGALPAQAPEPFRLGIIGLDTSHAPAFTKALNDPDATGAVARMRVVAAFPAGTDIPSSKNRVERFTAEVRGLGVEIVDGIDALLLRVDGVLLESVDGRPHLAQATPVIEAGKPLFIDKPLAGSLADILAIDALAKKHGVPWFSSSSLRFGSDLPADSGDVVGCDAWSPCSLEPTHPDLFWYGIHGVESLFTVMGPGCLSVTRTKTAGTDFVVGQWSDGRIGTFRGIRSGKGGYGATVFTSKGAVQRPGYGGYGPLVTAIAEFFATGRPPVPNAETIAIYAFMAAAHQSSANGGTPVNIDSVMQDARRQLRR